MTTTHTTTTTSDRLRALAEILDVPLSTFLPDKEPAA
jgi:hypothetical protein